MCVKNKSENISGLAKYRLAVGGDFGDEQLDFVEVYDNSSRLWKAVDNSPSRKFFRSKMNRQNNNKKDF